MTVPPLAPLLIVCDWIPPAFGAVGQYELTRAQEAAGAGREVTLIGLGDAATDEMHVEGVGRLRVVRIAAAKPNKASLLQRGLWALRTNARLLATTARVAKAYVAHSGACEIKVTGSPPFLSYLVLLWRGRRRNMTVTYRITDFYPETAFAAGKAGWLRPIAPFIHALRRRADRIEALSQCQAWRLGESGVSAASIAVVRDASPVAVGPDTVPAARPFTPGDVVLLYSGNLGVAHDWRTFAEGYRRHIRSGANRVRLWLNATGVGAPALRAYCEAEELPVRTSAPVPLDQLAGVLRAADAHLILLGDAFWGYVFPSKTYGCLDSGRPCLYVGPLQSDVHGLLGTGSQHASVRQGDAQGVFEALERLAAQHPVRSQSAA